MTQIVKNFKPLKFLNIVREASLTCKVDFVQGFVEEKVDAYRFKNQWFKKACRRKINFKKIMFPFERIEYHHPIQCVPFQSIDFISNSDSCKSFMHITNRIWLLCVHTYIKNAVYYFECILLFPTNVTKIIVFQTCKSINQCYDDIYVKTLTSWYLSHNDHSYY